MQLDRDQKICFWIIHRCALSRDWVLHNDVVAKCSRFSVKVAGNFNLLKWLQTSFGSAIRQTIAVWPSKCGDAGVNRPCEACTTPIAFSVPTICSRRGMILACGCRIDFGLPKQGSNKACRPVTRSERLNFVPMRTVRFVFNGDFAVN